MDYSELPKEIVEKIASQHLDTASQLISFSGVCKSWRSVAILLRCPPVLLVPETAAAAAPLSPAAASRGQIHDFVSLPTLIPTTSPPPPPSIALPLFPSPSKMSDAHGQRDRYLRLHQEFITSFPVIGDDSEFSPYDAKSDAHSLASKDGWILRTLPFHGDYRGRQLDLYLLNPFIGASIPLPPLKREYADVSKAIISNSPDHEHCYVFTFSNWQNNLLAWCKVGPGGGGGGGWTFPPKNCLVRIQYDVPEDASYSNGNLYLAGENALWVVHDILKPFSAAIGPIVKAFPFSSYMKSFDAFNCCPPRSKTHPYLCHLDGGQVRVILPDCKGNYYGDYLGFRVFKLVDEGNGLDRVMNFHGHNVDRGEYWEEVWSLDGHALFIGAHQSFSFPTIKGGGGVVNRNGGGIRGDHIYFALNRVCWDMKTFGEANWDGVFDVANQKFQRFADERYSDNGTRHPIFWFIPVPWGYSKSVSKHQKRKKRKGKKQREETRVASRVTEDNLIESFFGNIS